MSKQQIGKYDDICFGVFDHLVYKILKHKKWHTLLFLQRKYSCQITIDKLCTSIQAHKFVDILISWLVDTFALVLADTSCQ